MTSGASADLGAGRFDRSVGSATPPIADPRAVVAELNRRLAHRGWPATAEVDDADPGHPQLIVYPVNGVEGVATRFDLDGEPAEVVDRILDRLRSLGWERLARTARLLPSERTAELWCALE